MAIIQINADSHLEPSTRHPHKVKEKAVHPQRHGGHESVKAFFNRESVAGVVCAAPFIIGFLLFVAVPMGLSLYYSFTDYSIVSAPKWVGLANYVRMFTQDSLFWQSLAVTFMFAFISVPLKLAFALAVAMVLNKDTKLTGFYRVCFYLPSILGGSVAVAVLWKRMFAKNGVINAVLGMFGIHSQFSWLGSPSTAIWTLIMLAAWQFGSSMVIFLAALKQIPSEYYEAASMDGASSWRQFTSITLPLLTPTIFFNLVMQLISGFLAFTQCYVVTQGKPLNSTLFTMVYMYNTSFTYYKAGYGSAMAWVVTLLIGAMTGLLFATKRFWVVADTQAS